MTGLSALWLPILVSSVLVFVASSVIHMLLPWHKGDCSPVADQDNVMDALRPFAIPPGDYMIPRPGSLRDMGSPEYQAKLTKGPVLVATVLPNGQTGMGAQLAQWFVFSIVVGISAAYVASRALPAGAPYLSVFRFAGVTAFIGYSMALWELSIWYRRAWSTTIKSTVDGLIYACLTAGTFGWFWPGSATSMRGGAARLRRSAPRRRGAR